MEPPVRGYGAHLASSISITTSLCLVVDWLVQGLTLGFALRTLVGHLLLHLCVATAPPTGKWHLLHPSSPLTLSSKSSLHVERKMRPIVLRFRINPV